MIYPIKFYNSTVGSLVLINKMMDESIPAAQQIKSIENHEPEVLKLLVKSLVVDTYVKLKDKGLKLASYDTFRGPIFRVMIDDKVLPLREDLMFDPAFITNANFHVYDDKDFE